MAMRSRSESKRAPVGALAVGALCILAATQAGSVAGQSADWKAPPGSDFPLAGGSYTNQRYSTLDQINTKNVRQLGGAWSIRLEGDQNAVIGNLQGTPIVIDGMMYVTTSRLDVLAIDAATGAVKWRYRPASGVRIGSNKGVAVGDGKVFVGRRDNVLMALDQQTGHVVWERQLTDHPAAYSSAAPVFHDGRVFIGTAGSDNGARGQLGAYDAKTGQELWKFYTIPAPGERFGDTWEGDSYKIGGGGIWSHVALDPELGLVFMGTGNAAPDVWGASRGGDNLFTASVLALDLKTGAYRWHFQEVRHDVWDFDAGAAPVLADIRYRGRPRKILMHAGKTGYLYILDRTNGKPLIGVEDKPVPQEPRLKTAKTQPYPIGDPFVPLCPEQIFEEFERGCLFSGFWDKPVMIAPGSAGGNSWAPMAYSPQTGLVYVPGNVMPTAYSVKQQVWDDAKKWYLRRLAIQRDGIVPPAWRGQARSRRWIPPRTRSCGKRGRSFRSAAAAAC